MSCEGFQSMGLLAVASVYLNPCLVHPVALAVNKKNETPFFTTVFVVLSTLLHVSAYIGHLQVLRIQNVKRTAACIINGSVTITY
jgi:hypothetical protein